MLIKKAAFVKSSSIYTECPTDKLNEFAFIGRSNVGKSSLINTLVNVKGLAKTSASPGKTQLINHFLINDSWYIVDLPGYGYAKTSKDNRARWEKMIQNYFINRENLSCTFILVDARLEPQDIDLQLINWFGKNAISFVIAFTKTDKINRNELAKNTKAFAARLAQDWEELPMSIITSSKTKLGIDQLNALIEQMLD